MQLDAQTIAGLTLLWSIIQWLIQHFSSSKKDIAGIKQALKVLEQERLQDKHDAEEARLQDKAETARYRIIRFADECSSGKIRHSKDHFMQIRNDELLYKRYCETHPDFPNSRTIDSMETIDKAYQHCVNEDDFL